MLSHNTNTNYKNNHSHSGHLLDGRAEGEDVNGVATMRHRRAVNPRPSSSSASSSPSSSASDEGSDIDSGAASSSYASSCSLSSSSLSTTSTPSRDATGKKKKKSLYQRLLPSFIYRHGRTVYGGNPIMQQTLPGIFMYVSPFIMIPIFFLFMIPFVVIGAVVLVRSKGIYMVDLDYSSIHKYQYIPSNPAVNINQGIRSFTAESVTHTQGTSTWVTFEVTKRMKAPVYLYYKLDNFYQNHRDFHDGRNNKQLKGRKNIGSTLLCKPFVEPGFIDGRGDDVIVNIGGGSSRRAIDFTYNPCGLAAWSMFNDTLTLYRVMPEDELSGMDSDEVLYGGEDGTLPLQLVCNGTDFDALGEPLGHSQQPNRCEKKGISWRADTDVRFKPLKPSEEWWSLRYPRATDNDYLNNGWYLFEPGHPLQDPVNLDFQVWMKSSVLANFRKLYRTITTDLEPGRYALHVDEFFDVVSFDGAKHMVLRTGNWIGDSNVAIGVVYLVIGCLSFVMGVAFSIEYCLRRGGRSHLDRLEEPKRSWYVFDPQSPEFEKYFKLRTARHIPMAKLVALRKLQQESDSDDEDDVIGGSGSGSAGGSGRR